MAVTDLSEILKQRRLKMGLTISQLATAAGISQAHVYHMENRRCLPSARVLRKLAKPLGFAEVELFILAGYLSPSLPMVLRGPAGDEDCRGISMDHLPANIRAFLPWEAQKIFLNAFKTAESKGLRESSCFGYGWRVLRAQGYRKNQAGYWTLVKK